MRRKHISDSTIRHIHEYIIYYLLTYIAIGRMKDNIDKR